MVIKIGQIGRQPADDVVMWLIYSPSPTVWRHVKRPGYGIPALGLRCSRGRHGDGEDQRGTAALLPQAGLSPDRRVH